MSTESNQPDSQADLRTRRFHALFDSAADAIFLQGTDGRVLEANREACERYGYTLEEFRELDPDEILAPEFRRPFPDRIESVQRDQSGVFESVHRARDGTPLPIEANVQMVDFDGEPAVLAVCRDITARKRSQERLRLLEHSIEHSPDPIFWVDEEGRITYANHAAARMLGYSREELLELSVPDIDPGFGPGTWVDHWRKLSERGTLSIETQHRTRAGTTVPVEVHMRLLEFEGRRFNFAVVRDITPRRAAEAEARNTELRLRTVIDHAPLVLWAIDLEGTFTFSEGSGLRALGLTPGQVVGASIFDVYAGAPSVLEDARRALRGESFRSTTSVEGKSFDSHWAPLHDDQRTIIGAIGVAIDVSEQAQLEALLHHSQKMEAVGQLAGGVAHDFNNILQAIRGYTDLALAGIPTDSPEHAHLKVVTQATEQAVALIRQMLAFSRRERIHPEYLDVDGLVRGLTRMLGRVIGEHIDLEVRSGRHAPRIHADPGQIEQVLMNLCVNARDAMPEGGRITIESGVVEFDAQGAAEHTWAHEGKFARLSVTDSGTGIEPGIEDRIFEPFYTTKEVGQGTGLGLATAYAIVKRHGGWIDVESELEQGASFRVYLPCVEAKEEARSVAEQEEAAPGGSETILLAEDEKLVRRWTVDILQRAGYRVLSARDGEEAIGLLERHAGEIDLALVDVIMPKRSGREVFESVRDLRPELPVLFTSGYSFEVIDPGYLPEAELQLLQKPYDSNVLLRRVRDLLDG